MKPYHLFTIAILCLIAVLSSCNRQLTSVPGQPGDMYECEFVYRIYECAGSNRYCGRFKYGLYHFRMETALPIQPGDKVILDYHQMVELHTHPECDCDPE